MLANVEKTSIDIDVFDVFFSFFSKYLSFGEILGISLKKFVMCLTKKLRNDFSEILVKFRYKL